MKKIDHNIGRAELLSDRDVAELLRVSLATVWRWTNAGNVPRPVKIAGCTRWRRDELMAAIERAAAERDVA